MELVNGMDFEMDLVNARVGFSVGQSLRSHNVGTGGRK